MSEAPLYTVWYTICPFQGGATLVIARQGTQRFRGGLVLKAHILLYHSTLGLRVIKKKKNSTHQGADIKVGCR